MTKFDDWHADLDFFEARRKAEHEDRRALWIALAIAVLALVLTLACVGLWVVLYGLVSCGC